MNKALLDTDILSDIGKAKDATVAANAKTDRRAFGHYTFSTISVMEIISGFQRTRATGRLKQKKGSGADLAFIGSRPLFRPPAVSDQLSAFRKA